MKSSSKKRMAWWAWVLWLVNGLLIGTAIFIFCSADGIGYYKFEDSNNPQALKILFIGNSLTYVNDLPAIFASIVKQNQTKQPLKIYSVCYSNYYLSQHLTNPYTRAAISSTSWNYVIVQEHSNWRQSPGLLHLNDFRKINKTIKQKIPLAKIFIFQTWGDANWDKRMCQELFAAYKNIANELNCSLIPVGECWLAFLDSKNNSHINLYQGEGHHPSPYGSYLTACTIYASLFGKPADKLPTDIWRFGFCFIPKRLVKLSNNDAASLNETAKLVVLNK